MLSKSSFNALLKTLEEPPPHVKFLLATTDPQKLPVTVLSRCLQFNLSRLTQRLITDRLSFICTEEAIDAEPAALAALARAADGSLRDALSLLDQAIAYCGGAVTAEPVMAMLGTIDRDHVVRMVRLLADGDAAGVIAAVADIDTQFPDYARLLEDLARLLQRIAIHQVIGAADYEDEFDSELLAELAASLPAADVQLYYQTALIGRRDLYLAPDPRGGAEMTLLRMLAFRPAPASDAAAAPGAGSGSRQAPPKPLKADARPGSVSASPAKDERGRKWQDPDWNALISQLELKGAVRMLAINCAFVRRAGDTLYFTADAKAEPVLTRPRQQALAAAVSAHYGETLAVQIDLADGPPALDRETPVQQESRASDERYAAARRALESDPNIKALKSMFGAELKSDTIEPLSPRQSD